MKVRIDFLKERFEINKDLSINEGWFIIEQHDSYVVGAIYFDGYHIVDFSDGGDNPTIYNNLQEFLEDYDGGYLVPVRKINPTFKFEVSY